MKAVPGRHMPWALGNELNKNGRDTGADVVQVSRRVE